jgi:carbon storage regulator
MLVLTRKLGEIIRVGDTVTVRVLEVKGNQVRLGVEAPSDVRIYREEVYRAIRKENEEAALQGTGPLDEATHAWQSQHDKSRV